jgi:Rrf2 family protein
MLSQRARYALRALTELARRSGSEFVSVTEIAERQRIPRKFLELILLDLKTSQLVDSSRGRAGGYRLARPAEAISFGEIIRTLDGPLALVACVSRTAYRPCDDCRDEATCAIRYAMAGVRDEAARILDAFTLADALTQEGNM